MNADRGSSYCRLRLRESSHAIREAASGNRKRLSQIFFLIFLLCTAFNILHVPAAQADEPTTQPTTRPSEFPANSPFRNWFTKLTDADPQVRDQARTELMGMTADDLPAFRRMIETCRPLAPDQLTPLRDIVTQVFLSSDMYRDDGDKFVDASGTSGRYFLGVFWPGLPQFDPTDARLGVPIINRLRGFPSFRFLHEGDMILGVTPNLATPMSDTHTVDMLKMTLAPMPQPQNVILLVLRDGQQVRIPVRLAPHPAECAPLNDAIEAFAAARAHRADDYWNENFGALVEQETIVDAE